MHFKILCITNSNCYSELEDLLAPYQENNYDTCPMEYLEFEDETSELLELYEEYLREANQKKEIEVVSFDDYCINQGYTPKEEKGVIKYGYYYNPNARWDYWCVTKPKDMGVYFKKESEFPEEYPTAFPSNISDIALCDEDVPRQIRKYTRVWEQIKENAELEYGEPEVTIEEYPRVNWHKNKDEYINHETLGLLYNIYSVVTEDDWLDRIEVENIRKILEENSNKYVWIVDCHM